MALHNSLFDDLTVSPLDVIEDVADSRGWRFERQGDQELMAATTGRWSDYHMWFTWREDPNSLQFTCAYEKEVPAPQRTEISLLLALINERMWLGHFDLWSDEGVLMFHHALLLGHGGFAVEQCEALVDIALSECERYFPVFHGVISDRKSAHEAIGTAMLDTMGEA